MGRTPAILGGDERARGIARRPRAQAGSAARTAGRDGGRVTLRTLRAGGIARASEA